MAESSLSRLAIKKNLVVPCALAVLLGVLSVAPPATAAAPDGLGPWADSVVSFDQQSRKNGTPVLLDRSDPTDALGVAENDPNTPSGNQAGSFVSLGFGGSITLGFDNNVCNTPGNDIDLGLVEATDEPYGVETVDVFVSRDGITVRL